MMEIGFPRFGMALGMRPLGNTKLNATPKNHEQRFAISVMNARRGQGIDLYRSLNTMNSEKIAAAAAAGKKKQEMYGAENAGNMTSAKNMFDG